MASLDQHPALELVKCLYLGKPGSGKTGSLDSLVGAGYDLWIYDFDNLLGSLIQYVRRNHPDRLSSVHYQTFTDKMKGVAVPAVMKGKDMSVLPFVDGVPNAFTRGLEQLNRWKNPEDGDLGVPATFGRDSVVVIDSLTNLAACAFRWCQAMNPAAMDGRNYYKSAQDMVMQVITLLFSEQFKTNVIVLAHIDYNTRSDEKGNVIIESGFARTIGSALQDKPNSYFNCVLMAESFGAGLQIKRTIRTNSTGIVDLKNPVSFKVPDQLPLESGLATFFEAVTDYSPLKGSTSTSKEPS